MIRFLRPVGGRPATSAYPYVSQQRKVAGWFDTPSSSDGGWTNVATSGISAIQNVLVAREQRRAAGAGASASTVAAMQPGARGGAFFSGDGGTMGPALMIGLAGVALIMLIRR